MWIEVARAAITPPRALVTGHYRRHGPLASPDMPRFIDSLVLLSALTLSQHAQAAPSPVPPISPRAEPAEPSVHPSLLWLPAQLIPSPGIAFADDGDTNLDLAWQLTPVLWSYGMHRELSPWRFFVVEPLSRMSGSLELFGGAEYLPVHDSFDERWLFRGGIRTYVPVLQRGENLALSFGTSAYTLAGDFGVSWDAGVHVLYGILGLRFISNPGLDPARAVAQVTVRYF